MIKYVHIGFPKTATTFLQQQVFSKQYNNFEYIDVSQSSEFFTPVLNYDDSIFNISDVGKNMDLLCSGTNPCLFSYEPLTGLHHQSAFVNRTQIAKRLSALGFNKVILTIRNQYDILDSSYKEYIKSGGVQTFDQYIDFSSNIKKELYPQYFDYHNIYKIYADLFGAENILILQYENIESEKYWHSLARFLGIKIHRDGLGMTTNVSLSYRKTLFLQFINHFTYNPFRRSSLIPKGFSTRLFYRLLLKLPSFSQKKTFLNDKRIRDIYSFYHISNTKLENDADIKLHNKYPLLR